MDHYSTKNMCYFGLKLHTVAFYRKGTIPFPKTLILLATGENDPTVLKREYAGDLNNREIYADKIYPDMPFYKETQKCKKTLATYSCKSYQRRVPEVIKRGKAARGLFLTTTSKVRQPTKTLFSWLSEKTDIQRAMKVRFISGLLVHIMEKIVIALITLTFN